MLNVDLQAVRISRADHVDAAGLNIGAPCDLNRDVLATNAVVGFLHINP